MKKYPPRELERQKSKLQRKLAKFEEWQRLNPSKQFKDFFVEGVESRLKNGKAHATLGGNLLGERYGISGQNFFDELVGRGLKEEDTCVDYGCGTLRIGIHAINYLRPGGYWGLDIADSLLEEGRRLIGEKLWAEKQPNLRIISPQSVAEVAACRPTMLFSQAVLIHVPPINLPEYIDNIMTIIGSNGEAFVTGKWNDKGTIRYSFRSWAHDISLIQNLVSARAGVVTVLSDKEWPLEVVGQNVRRGKFRIKHANGGAYY